jgi:hypothetical protein
MTTRDYVVIADALKQEWNKTKSKKERIVLISLIETLAACLTRDNNRFNIDKFMGYIYGE